MRVRAATPADAAQACTIIRRSITELCVVDHESDEHLAKWLSNKSPENVARWITTNYYVVAEDAGVLLGVAGMNDTGKIVLNYVSPDARFRGVSKAMMQHLADRAVGLGLSECVLETNRTALQFYLARGYVRADVTYTLPLTGMPAVVLKKKCIGGPDNGGTYYELTDGGDAYVGGHPIPFGARQHVGATVRNNADGSVTLTLEREGVHSFIAAMQDAGDAVEDAWRATGPRGLHLGKPTGATAQ